MCGIAGFSFGSGSRMNRTLATQALLAGIAERGADAVGYAHRAEGPLEVHKQQTGASALLETVLVPPHDAPGAGARPRLHQGPPDDRREQPPRSPRPRDGDPQRDHRQRRGALRAPRHRPPRARDDRRLRGHLRPRRRAPDVARGARGARRHDGCRLGGRARCPTSLHVARGVGRPLWIARGRHEVLFASTRAALELVEHALRTTFRKTEVREGRLLSLVDGALVRRAALEPDRSYREERELPAVRAPHEGHSCRERLAALTALA